jgi:hypothetical protein
MIEERGEKFKSIVRPASISENEVYLVQTGELMRRPSGGEGAWFLEEESEPRNKARFLAGEDRRADVSVYPAVS